MTDHIQTNIIQFYSNLEPFRIAEKYTDLIIECEETYFQCHRLTLALASKFFDSKFADTFRELKEEHLSIREVDATTLGEVLRFIYTGDIAVTCANICDLFKASKFFALPGIADLCLKFVKNNKMTVNTTLKLYSLARQDTNEVLVDILSQDIADQFKIFARASMFLEIPFSDLKIILDKLSSLSTENEEALLGAIFRWFFHSRKERSVNFDQFYRTINFGNISTEVAKFLMSKVYKDQDAVELSVETVDPVGYDEFVAMPRKISSNSWMKKLHLFVRQAGEEPIQIFSINRDGHCEDSGEVHLKDVPQWIQTIALDNHLYCLHYVRRNSEKENDQKFRVYTSVNMRSFMELSAPPITFGDVNLCRGWNNNIYAYNQTIFEPLTKTGSRCSTIFTDEEMGRGIYVYNADLDIWLPVPAMQRKVEDACMTTHNGSLYLIGGINNSVDSTSATFVQTYDYREGKWRVLPSTNYDRIGADCCVLDGTIYVCGGRQQATSAERYNLAEGRWDNLENQMKVEMQYHRVINYNNKLWAVGGFITGSISINNLSIQDYPSEITSEVECTNCCISPFYNPQAYDFTNRVYGLHTQHTISSTSENNWLERDMLKDLKHSKVTAVILDGVVF